MIYKHSTPNGVEPHAMRVKVAISFGCGSAALRLCGKVSNEKFRTAEMQ
jgi:hypothetical protein